MTAVQEKKIEKADSWRDTPEIQCLCGLQRKAVRAFGLLQELSETRGTDARLREKLTMLLAGWGHATSTMKRGCELQAALVSSEVLCPCSQLLLIS